MTTGPGSFENIIFYDMEFATPRGELVEPVCLVSHNLSTGETARMWQDELREGRPPPFPIGENSLVVCYYAPAELACHIALGWGLPAHIIDLCVEHKCLTNGCRPPGVGASLLDALTWYGLDGLSIAEKESMRNLAQRGSPWTAAEKLALLDYCESDVLALKKLWPKILPHLDFERALYRGHCQKAMATVESRGVHLDVELLDKFNLYWSDIQDKLIARIDARYGVYDGRTFKTENFAKYLERNGISWPLTPTGKLLLDKDTFKDMSRVNPELASLHELRSTLSQMRLSSIVAGEDGRNRCNLWTFSAKTGRNQPSNTEFIFGASAWKRGLIQAAPGRAIAYIDYEQQEFAIAAALSKDANMMEAYRSGDAYLAFARQAGAIQGEYDEQTHKQIRTQYKICALGVQYGMGEVTLAERINQPPCHARKLLRLHRQTYPRFWNWSDAVVDYAMLKGCIHTVFGWTLHVGPASKPTSIRNFPMQSNGAEILRLACSLLIARGVNVCATVHDAVLIDENAEDVEALADLAQEAMAEAGRIVLDGFELRTEVKIFRHPDRFADERGEEMWRTVLELIDEIEGYNPKLGRAPDTRTHTQPRTQACAPGPSNNKYSS